MAADPNLVLLVTALGIGVGGYVIYKGEEVTDNILDVAPLGIIALGVMLAGGK